MADIADDGSKNSQVQVVLGGSRKSGASGEVGKHHFLRAQHLINHHYF